MRVLDKALERFEVRICLHLADDGHDTATRGIDNDLHACKAVVGGDKRAKQIG
jgi:hypothetical protein